MQGNAMQSNLDTDFEKNFICTIMWKQNPWSKPVKAFVLYWWYTGGILVVYLFSFFSSTAFFPYASLDLSDSDFKINLANLRF